MTLLYTTTPCLRLELFIYTQNLNIGGRGIWMPGVRVKENESFELALKRFKKQCEKAGILSEVRKREHYEKPSIKKKKKAIAARKRALKKQRKVME